MNHMKRKLVIEYNWRRSDGQDIPEKHIEALEESAWHRVVEMAEGGYTSGELNGSIRVSDGDPEDGVHYRGHWALNVAQSDADPRVLVVVSGGIADPVYDKGVDVEVFDRDNYNDDPRNTIPVPKHFRDLAEPIDVPVEGDEE